jgi:hypothetical protein
MGRGRRRRGLKVCRPLAFADHTIGRVSAEQVALILRCAECLEVWLPDDDDRWRAYLDTDDELVFYCPECAECEFDGA